MTDLGVEVILRARAERAAPPSPRRLTLQITNLCNSRCTMCSIWRIYRDGSEDLSAELTGAEWLQLVERAVAGGVRHVDITGGEPFMKEGIVELATRTLEVLGFTSIVTNAVTPRGTAAKIRRILEGAPPGSNLAITVSIDGLRETNAQLRGIRDGYDRACLLLGLLRDMQADHPGLNPNVSFTMQQENILELVPLVRALLDDGLIASADHFYFRPVSSLHYYRAANESPDALAAIREIERAQEQFSFGAATAFLEGVKVSIAEPQRMIVPCYALFASCWVDPYGNVSPCVTMTDEHLGNVRDHDLDIGPVWRSEAAAAARARIADDACPVCWTDCQANENLYYAGLTR